MDFSHRTTAYLESLQSKLIKSGYEIEHIDFNKEIFCINKVEHWKKRNGKIAKVYHHFRKYYQLPKEMIKYRQITKTGYSNSWVWADDPEYKYQVNQKYITKEDREELLTIYKSLTPIH
ncbi:MAG TPA: hypothetical protein VGN20_20660 [Mucilaginibacter sp.]|jgi:hypothetical protein